MNDRITARAIIPAEPGWYLMRYYAGPGINCDPIIAWDVERHEGTAAVWHLVRPIMAYGTELEGDDVRTAYKRPDGVFERHDEAGVLVTYATVAELIADFRRETVAA
jgi:hypothetical protein